MPRAYEKPQTAEEKKERAETLAKAKKKHKPILVQAMQIGYYNERRYYPVDHPKAKNAEGVVVRSHFHLVPKMLRDGTISTPTQQLSDYDRKTKIIQNKKTGKDMEISARPGWMKVVKEDNPPEEMAAVPVDKGDDGQDGVPKSQDIKVDKPVEEPASALVI